MPSNQPRDLNSTFHEECEFFFPDESAFQGKLEYSPDSGVTFSIYRASTSQQFPNLFSKDPSPPLSIRGHTTLDRIPFTLYNCQLVGSRGRLDHPGSTIKQTYVADILMLGDESQSRDSEQVLEIRFYFPQLDTWIHSTHFDLKHGQDQNSHRVNRIQVDWNIQDLNAFTYTLDDGRCISENLYIASDLSMCENVNLRARRDMSIKFPTPITLDAAYRSMYILLRLYSVLFSDITPIESLQMRLAHPSRIYGRTHASVDVFGRFGNTHVPTRYPKNGSRIGISRFFFKNFGKLLKNWFTIYNSIESSVNTFSTSQTTSLHVESRFVLLMQSIESFHRCAFPEDGTYMDPTEYGSLCQEIVEHFPSGISRSHRESLKKRIEYGNEYSLRRRMQIMLDSIPVNVLRALQPDAKKVSTMCVNNRNLFVHKGIPQDDGPDIVTVHHQCNFIRFMYSVLILKQCGAEPDELLAYLDRFFELSYSRSYLQKIATQ